MFLGHIKYETVQIHNKLSSWLVTLFFLFFVQLYKVAEKCFNIIRR
jgi:hypothetical protein